MTNKSKKISFYIPTMHFGGSERVVVNLIKEISKLNSYVVELVLFKKVGEFLDEVPENVQIYELNIHREYQAVIPLYRYLKKSSPDILISNYCNLSAIISSKFFMGNVKNMIICHNLIELDLRNSKSKIFNLARGFLSNLLYKKSDYIVAVSSIVASSIKKYYNINSNKITVINNPINLSSDLLWNYKRKKNKVPIILGVGRLVEEKNFSLLIDAFKLIHDQDIVANLFIIGDGDEKNKLLELANTYNLTKNISFIGFTKEPYKYMLEADILVVTSKTEGFCYVALEAIACGCPVVSTNCGGISDILTDLEYGRIITDTTPSELSNTIINVLNSYHDPLKLKKYARKFSSSNIAKQYLSLLEEDNNYD